MKPVKETYLYTEMEEDEPLNTLLLTAMQNRCVPLLPPVGAVLDVCFSHDGVLASSCSDDFSVKLWDLDNKECLNTCKGHTGWVVSVQVGSSARSRTMGLARDTVM